MRNSSVWKPTKYVIRKNRLCASSDRRRLAVSSRLVAQLVADAYEKNIPRFCRGDLADVGCGFVPMYDYYKSYVSSVTTIDWAESLHVNEHLDVIADLNKAPIPGVHDQSFDSVIMSDVLEHIYEPHDLLCELFRIMRPGASLLMNVPFHYCLHEIPHDYHRYTEFALKRYLEDAGFEAVEITPVGGHLACVVDLLSKGICLIGTDVHGKSRGRMVDMFVRLPCHLAVAVLQNIACFLRNTPPFRSLLQAKSRSFPLGYFVTAKRREFKEDPQ